MAKPTESSVKILLADDSVTMHRAVALALKKLPWQLMTCDNGQDALRLTLEQRPDVVIADLDMPGMTGAELCTQIRSKPTLAKTKVILLCGSFDQIDEARLDQIPADGRLWKPFESHVLTALIEALLKTQAAREGSDPTKGGPAQQGSRLRETTVATGIIPRENAEATADVVRDMTSETFATPLPPSASSLKERVVPAVELTPTRAMENLWGPELGFEEVKPRGSEGNPIQLEETEFSVYRDTNPEFPLPDAFADKSETQVSSAPDSSPEHMAWAKDAAMEVVSRPESAGLDEAALRKLVREEIEKAFESWLKNKLEKTLATVIAEIDRA